MLKIGNVEVGRGQPCRAVAEISNAHNGDYKTAAKLVDRAHQAGADIVKFQAYTPDELVELRGDGPAPDPWGSEGWTMRKLYEKARTPLEWLEPLSDFCLSRGVTWYASVFGPDSLEACEALGCPAYKISAFEFGNERLREMLVATGKPVIQSCREPGAPARIGADPDALYCPPGYPQREWDMRLANVRNGYLGFSYHGTDPTLPAFAVACGAKMVECHVQHDNVDSELEHEVCLKVSQFRNMVRMIRRSEEVLGVT